MSKITIQNVDSYPLQLASLTLGYTESAEVELNQTVQNYIDNGQAVVVSQPKKGKD